MEARQHRGAVGGEVPVVTVTIAGNTKHSRAHISATGKGLNCKHYGSHCEGSSKPDHYFVLQACSAHPTKRFGSTTYQLPQLCPTLKGGQRSLI